MGMFGQSFIFIKEHLANTEITSDQIIYVASTSEAGRLKRSLICSSFGIEEHIGYFTCMKIRRGCCQRRHNVRLTY